MALTKIAFWRGSRWWTLALGSAVLGICTFLLVDPYHRQMLCGPAPDGIPWCVWEDAVRRDARSDDVPKQKQDSWFRKKLIAVGILRSHELAHGVPLEIYHYLADDSDAHVRNHVLKQLAHRVDPYSITIIKRHLADDDASCRLTASKGYIWSLSKSRNQQDVRTLVRPFLDHEHPEVRSLAAWLQIEIATCKQDILDLLPKFPKDKDVRKAAAIRLAELARNRQEAEDALSVVGRDYFDISQVAGRLIDGLTESSDPMRFEVLGILVVDRFARVRFEVGHALRRHPKHGAGMLVRALKHPDRGVRENAADALFSSLKIDRSLFDLFAELAHSRDRDVRSVNAFCMRHFGRSAVPILRAALRDSDGRVRFRAIEATGALREDGLELVPDLLGVLDQPDLLFLAGEFPGLHAKTVEVLSERPFRRTDFFEPLARVAKHGNLPARRLAMSAMRHFRKSSAPVVEAGLHDPDFDVCWHALSAATQVPEAQAKTLVPALLDLQNTRGADSRLAKLIEFNLSRGDPNRFPRPKDFSVEIAKEDDD